MKERRLGFYFKKIVNNFEKKAGIWFSENNITSQQLHILVYLKRYADKKVYQKDLENVFDISNATISGILSRLEARNLISRIEDEKDSRKKYIILTDEGRNILESSWENYKRIDETLGKDLSEEELDLLESLLLKVLSNIKEDEK